MRGGRGALSPLRGPLVDPVVGLVEPAWDHAPLSRQQALVGGAGDRVRVHGHAMGDASHRARRLVQPGDVECHRRLDVIPRVAVATREPLDHARRQLERREVFGGLADLVGRRDTVEERDGAHRPLDSAEGCDGLWP